MTIDSISRLFAPDGVIDYFSSISNLPAYSGSQNVKQTRRKLNSCRATLIDCMKLFKLLTSLDHQLESEYQIVYLESIHHAIFQKFSRYYSIMKDITEDYGINSVRYNLLATSGSINEVPNLRPIDLIFLKMFGRNGISKIHANLLTGKYRLNIITENSTHFSIIDETAVSLEDIPGKENCIDSKKFFFRQLYIMLLSAESLLRYIANTRNLNASDISSQKAKLYFSGIELISPYASEYFASNRMDADWDSLLAFSTNDITGTIQN